MSARHLNNLFQMAQSGIPRAETELFEYLGARFRLFTRHRVWNSADAEDIVQEALVTVCREYKFLEVTSSFSAWAYKVLDNRLLAYIQTQRTSDRRIAGTADALEAVPEPVVDIDLRRRLLGCLKRICELNRRYGRALTLHAHGYGTDEICRRIDIKESTFYSLLHRGRTMLQHCLETGEIR